MVDVIRKPIIGNPDQAKICASHVERSNLSMRMHMRRLTRLANAFIKKWENLWAALSLWYTFYNFCRIHKSLRVTPAMGDRRTGLGYRRRPDGCVIESAP